MLACLQAEEALALRQAVESVSRDFLEQVVAEVTEEMSVKLVQEEVGEALFVETLLDAMCREKVEFLAQTVAVELVGEVCR